MANIPASKNNGRVARVVSGQRGGPGRGQGRKPVKAGEETVTVSLRMTEAQREKLALLGGADWIRKRIDKAKAPNATSHRGAACGASGGLPGCASNGTTEKE